jgi:hypothetical protein
MIDAGIMGEASKLRRECVKLARSVGALFRRGTAVLYRLLVTNILQLNESAQKNEPASKMNLRLKKQPAFDR